VFATEAALREVLAPDKINLASLGNMIPHLHWHIIPRYLDDPHFPRPIWAQPCRNASRRGACDTARLAGALRPDQSIIPLVESVAGWFEALALARAPRVHRLAFGSFDFMSDSGIQGDGEELDAVRTQLVLVSRLAGLPPPIDGVSVAIDDAARLEADVRRSRRYGFGAKLCIHPRQVAGVHSGFAPSDKEIAWARRVLEALASGPLGAIAVDGKLVDKPVALLAQSIVDEIDNG